MKQGRTFLHSWEEAVEILRRDPRHQTLIYDAYLTDDVTGNCKRFAESNEFQEVLRLVKLHCPNAENVLDMPGGNGIATYALANAGFTVSTVEPDPSISVGRGAIRKVLEAAGLNAIIVDAYGESLPFADCEFDVVYVRQGLHHARSLGQMLRECFRVLRPGGILLACREHVVDDYEASLQAFLDSQVDHQLYGGENAFTLDDYLAAIDGAGLEIRAAIAPYDSPINLHPNTPETLSRKIRESTPGKVLSILLPASFVTRIGMWRLRHTKLPGRLYSFVAVKQV
jgi:SAM-dependent methyltransferase